MDKEGRIAHVGHPMEKDFEEALDQVIAGTWDLKAAQARAAQAAEAEKTENARAAARAAAWQEVTPALSAAHKAKDWAKVLTLADQAEATHPDLKANLKRFRFAALARTDAAKAQALLDDDLAKPDVNACMGTAGLLLGESGLDRRWSEQALRLIDKAVELEPKLVPRVASYRFRALLRTDPAKARELFDAEKAKGAPAAAKLALLAASEDGVERPLLDSATGVLEEALKAPDASPFLHQGLAEAYFKQGRAKDAAAALETFLQRARKDGAPAAFLSAGEERLKVYQAAAK